MAMQSFYELDDPPMKHLFDRAGGGACGLEGEAVKLTAGAPGPDLLRRCLPLLQKATKHRLEREQEEANIFQYGPAAGSWEFREQLAKFLTEHYQDPVKRADLVLTCGATYGLQLVLSALLVPNGVIFVEETTYMIALDVFREFPAMTVVPVSMDSGGLMVSDLEAKAEIRRAVGIWEISEMKPFWAVLYCIPVFHNPTGVTLGPGRCSELLEVARRLQLLVLCDDVYNLLAHRSEAKGPPPPRRLFGLDRPHVASHGGNVISNGSFSKILAPGVRVGWLEAPPRLAERLRSSGLLRSSGAVNQYMSGVVASLLELGLQSDHLRFLTNTLQGRMSALCSVLEARLPLGCTFQRPQGGYYVWLQLPRGTDSAQFAEWSEREHGVTALPGCMFAAREGAASHCLRLAVAFHSKPTIEAAAGRLCEALKVFLGATFK